MRWAHRGCSSSRKAGRMKAGCCTFTRTNHEGRREGDVFDNNRTIKADTHVQEVLSEYTNEKFLRTSLQKKKKLTIFFLTSSMLSGKWRRTPGVWQVGCPDLMSIELCATCSPTIFFRCVMSSSNCDQSQTKRRTLISLHLSKEQGKRPQIEHHSQPTD